MKQLVPIALVVLGALVAASPVLYAALHPEDRAFGMAGWALLFGTVPAGGVLAVAGLVVLALSARIARVLDESRTRSAPGALGFYLGYHVLAVLVGLPALVVGFLFGATEDQAAVVLVGLSVLFCGGLALAVLRAKRARRSWPLLAVALLAVPAALMTLTPLGLLPAAFLTTRPVRGLSRAAAP